MDTFLTSLSEALNGTMSLALLASLAWGMSSVLLSPCHLSSIPLIIGFLTAQEERATARSFLLSLVFALGILLTIGVIGIITGAMGRIMGDVGPYGTYAVTAVFFAVGLYLMDILPLPDIGIRLRPLGIRSLFISAFSLGLIFGLALGPCTFAFMAPVLGVVFHMSSTNLIGAGALLLAFGFGHCSVIAVAGGLTSRIQQYLDWTNRTHMVLWTKRFAGVLVILGGLYSLYTL